MRRDGNSPELFDGEFGHLPKVEQEVTSGDPPTCKRSNGFTPFRPIRFKDYDGLPWRSGGMQRQNRVDTNWDWSTRKQPSSCT